MSELRPYFITCSLEGFEYGRDSTVIANNPVNLSLCASISKGNFAWYPDNNGKPSIKFNGCEAEWAYHTKEARDADFIRISHNR